MLKLKEEKGSAILEYVMVMPLIFLVLMLLLVMIFTAYDKAMLDGASDRGAIYAGKMIIDPQYAEFTDSNENIGDRIDLENVSGFIEKSNFDQLNPYRYFFMDKSTIRSNTKKYTENYIMKTSLFSNADPDRIFVDVEVENHIFYYSVEVISTKKYQLPDNLMGLNLGSFEIESRSYTFVNDPDEFIRNIDLANELLEKYAGETAGDYVSSTFGKVTDLFNKFFKEDK